MRLLIAACLVLALPALAQPTAPKAPPPPAGAQNSSFNLVNRGPVAVRELFVTSAGNANWGQNRLDGKSAAATAIAPGASFAVRRKLDTNCVFDIRVVFADGRAEDRRAVNTCAVEDVAFGAAAGPVPPGSAPLGPTGKPADDPSIKLFNRAARPITEFIATPAGAGAPGPNRLAGSPVAPDNNRLITLPRDGNCIFDLRVVFGDGTAKEKKRSNLCKISELPVP